MNVLDVQSALYGAKGDGVTDDTTAINNAVSALRARGGVLFFPSTPACYKVTSSLNLTNLYGVRISGGSEAGAGGSAARSNTASICSSYVSTTHPSFDLSGAQFVTVENISFSHTGGGSGAATVFAQRAVRGGGFCTNLTFSNVSIDQYASTAAVMLYSCEVVDFISSYIQTQNIGMLATNNNTYGVSSLYTTGASTGSESQISFLGGAIAGYGILMQLDGSSGAYGAISDISSFGTFFQNSAANPIGVLCKGLCWNLSFNAVRYEIPSASGSVRFFDTSNAKTVSLHIRGFNGTQGYALYSTGSGELDTAFIDGVSCVVSFSGTVRDLNIHDGNQVNVTISGSLAGGSFYGAAGIGRFVAPTAARPFTLQGWSDVISAQGVFGGGTKSYDVDRSGHFAAMFAYDECNFDAEADSASHSYIFNQQYKSAASVLGNPGYGTITCPPNSRSAGTNTVRATYNGTGDYLVIRNH